MLMTFVALTVLWIAAGLGLYAASKWEVPARAQAENDYLAERMSIAEADLNTLGHLFDELNGRLAALSNLPGLAEPNDQSAPWQSEFIRSIASPNGQDFAWSSAATWSLATGKARSLFQGPEAPPTEAFIPAFNKAVAKLGENPDGSQLHLSTVESGGRQWLAAFRGIFKGGRLVSVVQAVIDAKQIAPKLRISNAYLVSLENRLLFARTKPSMSEENKAHFFEAKDLPNYRTQRLRLTIPCLNSRWFLVVDTPEEDVVSSHEVLAVRQTVKGAKLLLLSIAISLSTIIVITSRNRSVLRQKISELKTELEIKNKALLQTSKMETLGELSAGIAHEIKNPIQFVGDNLGFFQKYVASTRSLVEALKDLSQENAELHSMLAKTNLSKTALETAMAEQALTECQGGLDQIKSIVRSLKDFSHPGQQQRKACQLSRIIENSVNLCSHEWKPVAKLNLNVEEDSDGLFCNEAEMTQVLVNLVVNAAHAIQTNSEPKSAGIITIRTFCEGSEKILEVEDNGGGIPTDVQEKIFQQFFTTKEVGVGTGLGLFLTAQIISRHGGSIRFETEQGKGTKFIIRLPYQIFSNQLTQVPAA